MELNYKQWDTVKAFILAGLKFGGFVIESYLAGIYFGIRRSFKIVI